MEFVAIDVETANADLSSICQIGIASYKEGAIIEEWKTYVDPEDYFDLMNVSIHGIDESTVKGSPILSEVASKIYQFLDNQITVCHTHFDRAAVQGACDKYEIRHPFCTWLDSARVVRRTWDDFAWNGYGLANVCEYLGYKFTNHDALEDAKAAGYIINEAIKKTSLDINDWLKRVKQPIDPMKSGQGNAIRREGNPEGQFYGEVVVFTGALAIPRREAADMAAKMGCKVEQGVNKETTILIVGDQDIKKLAGHKKSSKHRKAEDLISKGQSIRILRETDFKQLFNSIQ